MSKVVHFEIPVDNPEASQAFYSGVFGWQFSAFGGDVPYWSIVTGPQGAPGINGGMMKKHDPAQPVTVVIGVDDVDVSSAKIESAGGTIVVPKMPIPGVGYVAYFKDPDGNIVGIYHDDPTVPWPASG